MNKKKKLEDKDLENVNGGSSHFYKVSNCEDDKKDNIHDPQTNNTTGTIDPKIFIPRG